MIKSMLKLGITLALFAAGACVSLAIVYNITGPVIKTQEERALNAALKEIFPSATSFNIISQELSSRDPEVQILAGYEMMKDNTVLGVAVKASGPSYTADAILLSGIQADGTIKQVRVLQLRDTPGLGANATNPNYFVDRPTRLTFTGQFIGKQITDPFEVNQDVEAITASTITSQALTAIVKASAEAAAAYMEKQGGAI